MRVTFTKTVKCSFPATTFTKGRTYLMPEALAQGYIDSNEATAAEHPAAEPQSQPLADDGEDAPDLTTD